MRFPKGLTDEERKKYRKKYNDRYKSHGYTGTRKTKKDTWTLTDLKEIIINPNNLSDKELSFKLKRTITAVQVARYKFKDLYTKGSVFDEESE